MSTLYITEDGARVKRVDERLQVLKHKEVLIDLPLIKLSQIVCLAGVSVTAPAIQAFLERKISLCYLTRHGRYIGRIEPRFSKNSILRKAQYQAAFDEAKTLSIAKRFVSGKLANMRTMLRRANRKRGKESIEEAVKRIKNAESEIANAKNLDSLRGYEGVGSAAYFSVPGELLEGAEGFDFQKRVRRPPTDPVNALLSFGYALLFADLLTACDIVGFDPYIGYLHNDLYGRASLALDLMEEFRPLIVDSVVMICLNKSILKLDDFEKELGGACSLKDDARKTFLIQYEERKKVEFQHPIFGYQTSYTRAFELQTRLLAKFLQGDIDEYPPLVVR